MSVDELIDLLKTNNSGGGLTPLQELILRYSWEGKTYAAMAAETNYKEIFLRKVALWYKIMSQPISSIFSQSVISVPSPPEFNLNLYL